MTKNELWYLLIDGQQDADTGVAGNFYAYGEHLGDALEKTIKASVDYKFITNHNLTEVSLLDSFDVIGDNKELVEIADNVYMRPTTYTFPIDDPDKEFIPPNRIQLKNRPIDEDKVKEFMKKFSAGENFMKEFPGLVDEDTWVIFDGQHRYEACRRLNIPFVYRWRTKNSELTIDNISKVQSNARWTAEDFMHSFVQQKNQEYIDVQRFVNRYHFSVSTACMLLSINPNNPTGTHLGLKKNGFYEGTFRIVDYKYACEIAQRIEAFIGAGFKQGNQSAFITTYVAAMNHPDYDHKQMMTRLNAYPGILIGQTDANSYLRNLEKVYAQSRRLFLKLESIVFFEHLVDDL